MGKKRNFQPLMPKPNLHALEALGIKSLNAEKDGLTEAHSHRSSWRHHFENAINAYRLSGDLPGLKKMLALTSPSPKLSAKLMGTITTLGNTQKNKLAGLVLPGKVIPSSVPA